MTPTNDAEKAFECIVEAFLMNDYKSVWEKEVETIRTALAKSAKVDGLLEAGDRLLYHVRSTCNYNEVHEDVGKWTKAIQRLNWEV